jgi:hypothetical protein
MKVRTVGFYKEMPHGQKSSDSIYDFIKKEDPKKLDKICGYLKSGLEFVVTPGMVEDVIHPEKGAAGVPSIYTDGEWFWPGDLAYYVKNYRLKLPDEFVSMMEKKGWRANVSMDELDCDDIEVDGVKIF